MFIIIAFLILSFLIFFHELGHYLAARIFRVKVEVFSIGFGKKIITKTFGDTQYAISAIPLGGYVKLKGQSDLDPLSGNEDNDSYTNKSPIVKIVILLAGPLFNFLLAFLIYLYLAMFGIQGVLPIVGEVKQDMPAYYSGIKTGDRILSINEEKINTWNEIYTAVQKNKKLNVEVLRNEQKIFFELEGQEVKTKNIFNEVVDARIIGVAAKGEVGVIRYGFLDALNFAIKKVLDSSQLILMGVQKMIAGVVPLKEIGGPIMMVDSIAKFAQKDFVILMFWVALISVNLGVLNLLPIPALDGGQILFNFYELLRGRALPSEGVKYLTFLGWIILLGLMLLGLKNDLARLFGA